MFTLLYTTDCNKMEYEKYSSLEEALRARALAKECCYQNVYLLDNDRSFFENNEDFTFGVPVRDPDAIIRKEQTKKDIKQQFDLEWDKISEELAPILKKYKLEV